MRVISSVAALVLLFTGTATALDSRVTLYLDGARVEQSLAAKGNRLEIPLPAGAVPGSLRLVPRGSTRIERVEVVTAPLGAAVERELARIAGRRERLQDRLRALDTREEVFLAAAKSQSGKAPRKTKGNPEPLQSIRTGTDFALSQLEEVYAARRGTEKELTSLAGKEAELRRQGNAGGSIVRLRLAGNRPVVNASWRQNDLFWSPRYDVRSGSDATAEVTLFPRLPRTDRGMTVAVVPATLGSGDDATTVPVGSERSPVAVIRLPAEVAGDARSILSRPAVTLTNTTSQPLPSGEAACYLNGSYVGTGHLEALPPQERRTIVCGAPAAQK